MKPAVPTPAPARAPDLAGPLKPGVILGAPTVIMKGGTSGSEYDRTMARQNRNDEQRRRHQDNQYAAQGARSGPGGFSVGRMGTSPLNPGGASAAPGLVLSYMNRDKTVERQCRSELTTVEHPTHPGQMDATFTLVCPRCVSRGVPQGQAQLFIRDSHRKFYIDQRKAGPVQLDTGEVVLVAGTVTVQDRVKCSNYNCDFEVRIENSRVWPD